MLENKGLGDTIEMITKVTGIKAAVGAISELVNVPCGCQERKEKLNKRRLINKNIFFSFL